MWVYTMTWCLSDSGSPKRKTQKCKEKEIWGNFVLNGQLYIGLPKGFSRTFKTISWRYSEQASNERGMNTETTFSDTAPLSDNHLQKKISLKPRKINWLELNYYSRWLLRILEVKTYVKFSPMKETRQWRRCFRDELMVNVWWEERAAICWRTTAVT